MQLFFENFLLDTRRGDLRFGDEERPLEPRAFSLLCLLAESQDRLVSKDEILEKVWDGRVVSDSAVSTVVKAVRKALGDNGETQKYVRTVRGRGFRFVAPVRVASESNPDLASAHSVRMDQECMNPAPQDAKPLIAVLPFGVVGYSDDFRAIGDALPAELISSPSRLRWLRVIARGSSFRFRNKGVDPNVVRSALGVAYCISGTVDIFGRKLTIMIELTDTATHNVIWSARYSSSIDKIHEIRVEIIGKVIGALELHFSLNEAEKARINSPDAMDAWSEYHNGLQHMYRFNRADNEIAAAHFERATGLDPRFARAFAARSFTSFQNAFLKYSSDPGRETANALKYAEKGLELDPLDPFRNYNLARTHWLDGDPDGGLELLSRAIEFNPNFAQGHYALAWTDAMAGRGQTGLESVAAAITLSPLDPLLYAMLTTREFSSLILGDYAGAAEWAERGARSPGSHFLVGAFAVAAHQLNSNSKQAEYWSRNVRRRRPDTSIGHFFTAFPFTDARVREEISSALAAQAFPEN